ncbi:GNAT family N-acetyltransferase [Desulfogranum mediterraneum]|uniref:GNAT family N-acetyltransferase n=1 Tax=Desulfogranum mediterraneum TaxID=160661 RepID=UPI0003F657D2|nr:GNAT family N-acetyltransferase [Desulfogranum mediterraneum]
MTQADDPAPSAAAGVSVCCRPAWEGDLDSLGPLLRTLGYRVTPVELAQRLVLIRRQSGELLVAEKGEQLVGCIQAARDIRLAEGQWGEIVSLVVAESYQGQGGGQRLLSSAESWLRAQGLDSIRIRANSRRTAAHRFYLRQGYQAQKQQQLFIKQG